MSFLGDLFQHLEAIPGSPESGIGALMGGFSGDLSWNPYSSKNSVFDFAAGGSEESQDPSKRAIGRQVGSMFAGGALSGLGSAGDLSSAQTAMNTGAEFSSGYASAPMAADVAGPIAGGGTAELASSMGSDTGASSFPANPGGDFSSVDLASSLGSGGSSSYNISDFPTDPGSGGGGSWYDKLAGLFKGGASSGGMGIAKMFAGLYGLQQANQLKKMATGPNKAGEQAIQRSMQAQGYGGSGNLAMALGQYASGQSLQGAQVGMQGLVGQLSSLGLLTSGAFGGSKGGGGLDALAGLFAGG